MDNSKFQDVFFDAIVIEGNEGWVFANNVNALIFIDLNNNESKYLGSVPSESIVAKGLFCCMLKAGNNLILLPANASSLAIYDINSGEFITIKKLSQEDTFFAGCIYKDKVFMIGHTVRKICVLELSTYEMYYLTAVSDLITSKPDIEDRVFCRKSITRVNESFYFALCGMNGIARLDLDKETVEYIKIDEVKKGLRNLCYEDEGIFWINEYNTTEIIRWSQEEGVLEKYKYDNPDYIDYRVGDMFYTGRVWLFPTIGKDVLTFSPSKGEWEITKELVAYGSEAKEHRHPWGEQSFPVAVLKEDMFYVFAGNTFDVLRYSFSTGKIEKFGIRVNLQEVFSGSFMNEANQGILKERSEFGLREYLISIW